MQYSENYSGIDAKEYFEQIINDNINILNNNYIKNKVLNEYG